MALFIKEDSKKLKSKQITIPDDVAKKLRQNMNMYSGEKTSNGYKRLKSLTDKEYNKRSDNKDSQHNNKMTVSFGDARRIVHDMSHMEQSPKNKEFNMIGGYDTLYALQNGLKQARSSVKQVSPVPEVPKLVKNPTKVDNPKDDIKMGSINVHINESMGDFLDDYYYYATSEILDYFLEHGEEPQNWGTLINPSEYQKALSEFVHYGKLINFPSDRVYQWMGIIMRNTAKIYANTILRGHEQEIPDLDTCETFFERYLGNKFIKVDYKAEGPKYYVDENFLRNRCEQIKMHCKAITLATNEKELVDAFNSYDYERSKFEIQSDGRLAFSHNYMDFFDEIGLYDTMVLPDGSDAISDYGLRPLFEIIDKYDDQLPPEEVLVLVNKCLDIYHCRGDLASAFIVGGSKSLTAISEETEKIKNTKTIYLTEEQLKKLVEYHNQLKIPFDNPSAAYGLKDNYEHFIDYLESIGRYGKLGVSELKGKHYPNFFDEHIDGIIKAFRVGNAQTYEIDGLSLFIEFITNNCDDDSLFYTDRLKPVRDLCRENDYNLTVNDLIILRMLSQEEVEEYEESIDPFELLSPLNDSLSKKGVDVFRNDIVVPSISNFIYDHIDYVWEIDDRGLIRIEREITIPNMFSPYENHMSGVTHNKNNYYNTLNGYDGIGMCWSFANGHGEAYCGENYETGTYTALLVGYVDPKDVDWGTTLELNLAMPDEYELRLNNTAVVEIDEVIFDDSREPDPQWSFKYKKAKLPLKSPIVVRVE